MVDGVIVLYEQNETNFTSNGLGYLSDVIECTVSEELNGEYELEMEYPVDGIRYSEIQHRRILYVKPNPYEDPQPFRIYNINRPIDGRVEINARHISYDLSGYTVSESENKSIPFSTSPKMFCEKIPSAMTELNSGMPQFTFWTNSVEEYDSETYAEEGDELKEKHWIYIDTPSSVRSLIGQFTEKYKGEFKFDKYAVKFYGPVSGQSEDDKHYRGTDSGVVLRYGKNLTDLMQEEDSDKGMYTHLYPYWSGTVNTTNTDSESNESSSSTTYSSHSEEKVVTMTNKLYPIFDHDVGYKRVLIYEVNSDWNEKHPNNTNDATPWPSEEDFEELCKEYIKNNELGIPKITLTASFIQLSRSAEYEDLKPLEKVLLGDTVSVLWEELGVDSTLKCTKTEYDALMDSYKSITLGNDANSSISSTVAATSSGLSGVTSSMSDKVSKEEFYNQTYDTALSTTSTNAVQNKVVTSKFNSVDKTCNSFKNDIANILSIVENLNPSAISYGYSLPTGGSDGDAYVQITSTPKDPRAVVSESTVHNNFEVSNFTQSGTKYSFDISGTVDADQINYALVNVDNLRSGSEYKVKMRLSHDVPTASLDRSEYYSSGAYWRKAFGLFIGTKNNLKTEYVNDQSSGNWFANNAGINEYRGWDNEILNIEPTSCYQPHMQYQGFYKDVSDREYDFYFTASGTSASFGFVFDDCLDETTCNMSIVDMEVIYVGSPKISVDGGSVGSSFANSEWNSNWAAGQGISDSTVNSAWTNWGGGNNVYLEPFIGFTFNQATMIDRVRLNCWEGMNADDVQDVVRTAYIEASTDDEEWNSENKEWVNVLPTNTSVDIPYPWNHINHIFFNINKGTYHDIRIRFVSPVGDGKLEAIQCYLIEDQITENHVKDLFFKCDGEWLVYPNDPEDEPVFTYGSEDPDENTEGDIYAKLTDDTIDSISYKVNDAWLLGPSGGGSGGGSGFTKTLLWDSGNDEGTGAQMGTVYTLSDNLSKYNMVYVEYGTYIDRSQHGQADIPILPRYFDVTSSLLSGYDQGMSDYYQRYCYVRFTDTTFEISRQGCPGESDGYKPRPYKIYGIKFSGGSGGGGRYTETELYNAWDAFADGTTITLSDRADNYDAVIIFTSYHEISQGDFYTHFGSATVYKEQITQSISETQLSGNDRGIIPFMSSPAIVPSHQMSWMMKMTAPNMMYSYGKNIAGWSASQCGIYKIVGIKY